MTTSPATPSCCALSAFCRKVQFPRLTKATLLAGDTCAAAGSGVRQPWGSPVGGKTVRPTAGGGDAENVAKNPGYVPRRAVGDVIVITAPYEPSSRLASARTVR